MIKIDIKPLSVNKAWKGKRYKTKDYEDYERAVLLMLPNKYKIPDGRLILNLRFGFSNQGSDLSNPIKLIEDILQKKYDFNDNRIFLCIVEKEVVKKGKEYIQFSIESYKK